MTRTPILLGFDDVTIDRAGGMAVSIDAAAIDLPVWTYWFPLMCLLSRGRLVPAPANLLAARGTPFVYPLELRFEAEEWCADNPGAGIATAIPEQVARAAAAARAVIVVSLAHEGRRHFSAAYPEDHLLLDRLRDLSTSLNVPTELLWFVTGNLEASQEVEAWCRERGLTAAPFTLRCCEPFSAFISACCVEGIERGRAPTAVATFSGSAVAGPLGEHRVGWRRTVVGWAPRRFLARPIDPAPPRFSYACLNRAFRSHRWEVLMRLRREGLLDAGLVSFPLPSAAELRWEGIDLATPEAVALLSLLPMQADRCACPDERAYFNDNAGFIGLHPPIVTDDCAAEIVTETCLAGPLFVSEKSFKAMLGRGPAVVVGTAGTIAHLQAIGARTWGDDIDESYDRVSDPAARLDAALTAALPRLRTPSVRALDPVRAHNLRWLTEAPKPWDCLLDELGDLLAGLRG